MTEQQEQTGSQPPPPPPFPRKIQLHRVQLIGMPLLMLVPLLAILGVFGETFATTKSQHDRLTVQVHYATRYRYKMANPVEVAVHNDSTAPLAAVEVRFAKAYIDQFSDTTFTPQVETITDQFYIVRFRDLQPDETRIVTVSLQGERYGRHQGVIVVADADDPAHGLETPIATWIFP
ncbi:MAG: hypothetical protein DYG89_33710 [Caldilinea sp. CFX5]|nr:hypothetical protein [Caldilinea sp. CFX5]